jgi:hypothetical protein
VWTGSRLCSRKVLDDELRDDFGVVLAAVMTPLGLVIGFSFSMAISRYDERKMLEEAEANAIGTEYLRAGRRGSSRCSSAISTTGSRSTRRATRRNCRRSTLRRRGCSPTCGRRCARQRSRSPRRCRHSS